MKVKKTEIEGLIEIEPKVFEDERGYFFESFNEKSYGDLGIKSSFIQDNQSLSHKGALRGLHFQNPPFAQGKLVRVIKGSVLDVAVDLRKKSSTYGKYYKTILSGDNKKSLWIPRGFAHGFLTLENDTIFSYKVDNHYNKESEDCLIWNDEEINIDWEIENLEIILSDKDKLGKLFSNFESLF